MAIQHYYSYLLTADIKLSQICYNLGIRINVSGEYTNLSILIGTIIKNFYRKLSDPVIVHLTLGGNRVYSKRPRKCELHIVIFAFMGVTSKPRSASVDKTMIFSAGVITSVVEASLSRYTLNFTTLNHYDKKSM